MTELLTVWLPRAVCTVGVFALVWVGVAIVVYERRTAAACSDEEDTYADDEGAEWDRARDRDIDEQMGVAS